MKWTIKTIFVAAVAAGLVACGGGEAELTQCGDDTEPDEDGVCVPVVECGEGEVHDDELGLCVRAGYDYCGEGTEFDETFGRCVADGDLACGDDTVEEDGECTPQLEKSCGPGTVALAGECVPDDGICAEGTDAALGEEVCRPTEEVCGEGTTYDIGERLCIPTSTLECGDGTTVTGDLECIPTFDFYAALADDPDLDMTGQDGVAEISPADPGEKFVFVGAIDEPDLDDGELVQSEDVFHLDAETGQWLRVGLYSMGLPEPGFTVAELVDGDSGDSDPFFWRSDLAAGVEVTREILIPADASYELVVSNMPQMIDDTIPPAGAEDWEYVGFIETMHPPEPIAADVPGEVSGDIRELSENFYVFDDMAGVESMGLLFESLPTHAEANVQLWSDETTLERIQELGGDVISIEPPGESFFLAFDSTHAFGDDVHFSASTQGGASLAPGQSTTQEVQLEPGDYVGLFQDNLAGESLSAAIRVDGEVVADTGELAALVSAEGQIGLYWYAPTSWDASQNPVQLEVENTTGDELAFVSIDSTTGSSDLFGGIDGTPAQYDYSQKLPRSHRHYVRLELETDELLSIELSAGTSDGRLRLYDDQGAVVVDGLNLLVVQDDEGQVSYVLGVEALKEMPDGFSVNVQKTDVLDINQTSEPGVTIPENDTSGVDDSMEISGCNTVADINMDVVIEHGWRGDLVVRLTNPEGDSRVLKSRPGDGLFGDSADDIIGNFNETLDPETGDQGVETAEPIDVFAGSVGNGEWTLNVSDNAAGHSGGQIVSWTLNLTCDG